MKSQACLVVMLCFGSELAFAQGQPQVDNWLFLRVVPTDVLQANPLNLRYQSDTQHDRVGRFDTNRTRRFEVQFQISEPAGFEGFIASLASVQFSINTSTAGGSLASPQLQPALLTQKQASLTGPANSVQPVGSTDLSGSASGTGEGRRGLHQSFRGGLSPDTADGNSLPPNGTMLPGAISQIAARTLSQLNQNPANDPTAWYGLYSFEVMVGENSGPSDAVVNLSINVAVEPMTQTAWWAFEDGDPVLHSQRFHRSTGASFVVEAVPAPGTPALGLLWVAAAMRRRGRSTVG